jgi:hypothetical protein
VSTRDLYRYTSIGRPLDPSYPTNRAVLRLLPAAAFVAAAIHALRHGIEPGLLWAAVGGALAAFGGWALARELVPDHQAPAFAAMALAFGAWLTLAGTPLLPVFVALFLVRLVNRSVGLPARQGDALFIAALAIGAAWLFDNPWFALLGGMAFLVDATVPPPLERHRLFAVVCAGAGFWLFTGEAAAGFAYASPLERWLPLIVAGGFLVVILLTTRVEATGDATGEPLSLARVRAGMWVGLFTAAQSLLGGPEDVRTVALVWATLAGATLHRPARAGRPVGGASDGR